MADDRTAQIPESGTRRRVLVAGVGAVLLVGTLHIALATFLGWIAFRDVNYPDSANLMRTGDLVTTGHLYPDPELPPFFVTLYGPLTYVLLGIPYGLAQLFGAHPQHAVRIGISAALGISIFLVFLIARRLYGTGGSTPWFCAAFAIAIPPLAEHCVQIKGDFFALAFSLLCVHLFVRSMDNRLSMMSACCAAMAVLVKPTFVAAPAAVLLWLILRARFRNAISWAAICGLTVTAGFGLALWHEPMMLQHVAALRNPVLEYRKALDIALDAASQPVTTFALVGAWFALRPSRDPRRLFIALYCALAWLSGLATIPQVGGNINYFWEPMVASAILAGQGLLELQRIMERSSPVLRIVLGAVLVAIFVPALRNDARFFRDSYRAVREFDHEKTNWENFARTIKGRELLSTMPDVSVLGGSPQMPDSFLNAVLEIGGTWNPGRVVARIQSGLYELIVMQEGQINARGFRGIPPFGIVVKKAVREGYQLVCVYDHMEIWMPRGSPNELLSPLQSIGCRPVSTETAAPR